MTASEHHRERDRSLIPAGVHDDDRQERALRLSVVVPCYNEEDTIDALLQRVTAACEEVVGDAFEIVLIDHGSTDGTLRRLTAHQTTDPRIVVAVSMRICRTRPSFWAR